MRETGPLTVLVALIGVSACGVTDVERDTGAPIQTSDREYVLRDTTNGDWLRASIPYRYQNRTQDPICMTHCNGAYFVRLEKRVMDEWVPAWNPVLPLCLSHPPITIQPGATLRDTLLVTHGTREDTRPQIDASDLEGVYRLDVTAASRLSSSDQCGDEQVSKQDRVSNRFVLKRE